MKYAMEYDTVCLPDDLIPMFITKLHPFDEMVFTVAHKKLSVDDKFKQYELDPMSLIPCRIVLTEKMGLVDNRYLTGKILGHTVLMGLKEQYKPLSKRIGFQKIKTFEEHFDEAYLELAGKLVHDEKQ